MKSTKFAYRPLQNMDNSAQQCKNIRWRGTIKKTIKAKEKRMTENANPKPFNISHHKSQRRKLGRGNR